MHDANHCICQRATVISPLYAANHPLHVCTPMINHASPPRMYSCIEFCIFGFQTEYSDLISHLPGCFRCLSYRLHPHVSSSLQPYFRVVFASHQAYSLFFFFRIAMVIRLVHTFVHCVEIHFILMTTANVSCVFMYFED